MSSNVRRRRRTIEERLGAAVRHLRPGDLAGRGEPLPRDRGATRVSGGGPDEDGDRGSHIEHVTLEAAASQTIASGGAGVSWAQIAGPPTERLGFETLSARIAADGSVVAIPIDLTGELEFGLLGEWAAYRGGGTITLTRLREDVGQVGTDVDTVHEFTPGPIKSRLFWERQTGIDVRSGDTVTVTLPNSSGSGAVLSWAEAQLRVIGSTGSTTPPPPEPLPEWTVSEVYNGTGSSGARYEVQDLVDNGNMTWSWKFRKVGGWGNTDATTRQRLSDDARIVGGAAYKFTGDYIAINNYSPASPWDGVSSHRYWVTNSGTGGINPTADTYVEFQYNG